MLFTKPIADVRQSFRVSSQEELTTPSACFLPTPSAVKRKPNDMVMILYNNINNNNNNPSLLYILIHTFPSSKYQFSMTRQTSVTRSSRKIQSLLHLFALPVNSWCGDETSKRRLPSHLCARFLLPHSDKRRAWNHFRNASTAQRPSLTSLRPCRETWTSPPEISTCEEGHTDTQL